MRLWELIRCEIRQRRRQRERRRSAIDYERPLSLRLWVESNGGVFKIEHDAGVKNCTWGSPWLCNDLYYSISRMCHTKLLALNIIALTAVEFHTPT